MRLRPMLATMAVAAAVALPTALPAQAAAAPEIDGLAGPLAFSVDHGYVYVAQSFAGKLTRFRPDGSHATDLYTRSPRVEIGAVEAKGPGTLFAVTGKTKAGKKFAKLLHRAKDGTITTRASLRRFEKVHNPDHSVSYGFRDLTNTCAGKVPDAIGGKPYRGKVDSHPYATAMTGDGSVLVADAAGNDLLRVSRSGAVNVVALLPAQPLRVTKAVARHLGLPKCTRGHRYWFEPVPTDVEVRGNRAYVTTLPGGPEDPSLGARGKVYTVNLGNGHVRRIGRGFLGATGLAVTGTGKVYVAELFGNRVSTIVDGRRSKVASVPGPSAIEWHNGRLWTTSNTFGPASIMTISP